MSQTVLVVDDDPDIRDLLTLALEMKGYHVESACDGLEALEVLRGVQPVLILLDLSMPRMDGPAFARELLRRPHGSEVPIVVLSAVPHAGRIASNLNARGCILKPFQLDEVFETIDRMIQA